MAYAEDERAPVVFGPMHHVGVVVRDLDQAVALYRDRFGFLLESLHDLGGDGVRAAFLRPGSRE